MLDLKRDQPVLQFSQRVPRREVLIGPRKFRFLAGNLLCRRLHLGPQRADVLFPGLHFPSQGGNDVAAALGFFLFLSGQVLRGDFIDYEGGILRVGTGILDLENVRSVRRHHFHPFLQPFDRILLFTDLRHLLDFLVGDGTAEDPSAADDFHLRAEVCRRSAYARARRRCTVGVR